MITKEALQFLEDLIANNNTDWMHANKKRYEQYKKDYHAFIAGLLAEMKQLDPKLDDLEVKNCTFRINRDIRFSKDKSPYKTNMGVWFTQNKFQKNSPGYYVHFEKGNCFVAGGVWCPEPSQLKQIRREIAFFYDDLEKIVADAAFKKEYSDLSRDADNVLKKAPKDFDHVLAAAAAFIALSSTEFALDCESFTDANTRSMKSRWFASPLSITSAA